MLTRFFLFFQKKVVHLTLSCLLHMPSSVIMFWCNNCAIKENRCWFGNPFALSSVCLLGHNSIVLAALSRDCRWTDDDGDDDCLGHGVWCCQPWLLPIRPCLDDLTWDAVDVWRIQSSRAPSVEDDEEGHLIYRLGDVLQDRCSWIHFVTISNTDKFY